MPRKIPRTRRKRNALAEVPVNVPRGENGRRSRQSAKLPKSKLGYDRESTSDLTPSLEGLRNNRNIFQDEDSSSGKSISALNDYLLTVEGGFEPRAFATPSQREQRCAPLLPVEDCLANIT